MKRAETIAEVGVLPLSRRDRVTERYAHLCPGGIADAARATTGELPATGQQVANVIELNARAVKASVRDDG